MEHTAAKSARDSEVVMTQLILPSDANNLNSAFGGKVMEWIDICGAVAAQRHCRQVVVTASIDDLHFHSPIRVGWIAQLRARVLAAFRTSMEVGVTVHAENPLTGERSLTTSALMTFVALNQERGRVQVPPLKLETEEERLAAHEAEERRTQRISRRQEAQNWLRVMKE
ncbi:acyl-CoA thioesterase [Hyalangium minutum]|uniref:Acyl-CoA thioester hydrolase n=1 Tax=Hyalangium minutum TaxID=394096 RepID=A0A085WA53_9BACT|nr:acyl-CoA thioesterase [Hyalangium minutum]KFE64566.1 Acyl-CoA thioester hydrolase [Hyalangium minutum]